MDRSKVNVGRGGKGKAPQFPGDLYILGPKGARSDGNESRRPVPVPVPTKPGPSSNLADRRRLPGAAVVSTTSGSTQTSKKPKLSSNVLSRPGPFQPTSSAPEVNKSWELLAIDVESIDLVPTVLEAKGKEENEKITVLLCSALKQLKASKMKTDTSLTNGLLYLAKKHSSIFSHDTILNALCCMLKRESSLAYRTKTTYTNAVLIVNILFYGYQQVQQWPDVFLKVYIEDSLGERLWVDSDQCKCFVDNIICSVNTLPSPSFDMDTGSRTDTDEGIISIIGEHKEYYVNNRYKGLEEIVENIVMDAVKDQMNRRQATEGISKHFLKFLCSMCGITEVRAIVASKLEVWLTNPKLKNNAKELLMAVCVNCTSNTPRDIEIVASIVKIKLKVKDLHGFYLSCISEMIPAHDNNLPTVLRQIVNNEIFAARNQNYVPMLMFSTLYQADPDQFASILAKVILEYLIVREDNLRPLRSLLREVNKVLRTDLDFQVFVRGLMKANDPLPPDFEFKDRVFAAIADLISLCIFLAVSLCARAERKDGGQIERTQALVASIQSEAVLWFYESAFRTYRPPVQEFVHALHKVVFMEPAENYYRLDNWPPDQDRALFFRLATEIPLLPQTVSDILRIGLSRDLPLSCADALELVEQLVRRASALAFSQNISVLTADDLEIVDLLFNISAYRHPENTELPADYTPPNLAVCSLYWKSWIILLIYTAHVPGVFGALAWEKYPTLRVFIEMCITNHFVFPLANDDQQFVTLEKQNILEYETYLAKNTITESSSLLLSQVMTMDPFGACRRPPSIILDHLQLLNSTHKIGQLLCRSRDPDFLLDIIRKQGSSQSMPWLADLVQNSEGSFDHLPVQCLCEFLLSSPDKQGRYQQLLTHLKNMLSDPTKNPNVVCEILDHFLRRFSSHTNKDQAILGLKMLLSSDTEEETEADKELNYGEVSSWILSKLPSIPHFQAAKSQIVTALREACQIENDPELITSYLIFLAQHVVASNTSFSEMTKLVFDMATLIVERSTIMTAILPSGYETDPAANSALTALLKIFSTYLSRAREPRSKNINWHETQEQIIVLVWPSGEEAMVHILVVHAIIILLSYKVDRSSRTYLYSENLLDILFPVQKELAPKAYLVDSREEALLIPDWLKLRMIRSHVPRLVDEAFVDLGPTQWLLFIQSFGIPVPSMSKLLETLDMAAMRDRDTILSAVIDRTYMIKLVEIQQNRGATGGTTFANAIKSLEMEVCLPESSSICLKMSKAESMDVDISVPAKRISDEEIDQIIDSMNGSSESKLPQGFLEKNKQTLLQILSTEIISSSKSFTYPTRVLKRVMNKLLRKCTNDLNFKNQVVRDFRYPSNIFRLLTTSSKKEHNSVLVIIAKTLLECPSAIEKPKNPLVVTLKTFLNKINYSEITDTIAEKLEARESLNVFHDCTIDQLEKAGSGLIESVLKGVHGSKRVIETISTLITQSNVEYKNASGLFIDWLIQIEPEILGSSLNLQMDMLFSPKRETQWESLQMCRPYLLTLLTHHASWRTLETALSMLLTLEATQKYDATAVLDFLWAVARNPRLWQGREFMTPKHQESEDVLELTESELICVVEYIVWEVESLGFSEKSLGRMNHRLSQLVKCAIKSGNKKILISIIEHLHELSTKSEIRKEICQNFLAHLYLRIPHIINLLPEMQMTIDFNKILKSNRDCSVLDVMSHAVLTSFTTNSQIKEAPKRTQELEMLIRKMCASHPRLVLRQLMILKTSLLGRIHFEWPAFRNQNNHTFFPLVFGILETLQPHIFALEFTSAFQAILDVYLNLFKTHGGRKEVDLLMPRFVTLSQNYISADTKRAVAFYRSRSGLIRDLASFSPCLGSLCVLTAGVQNTHDTVSEREILIPATVRPEDAINWDNIIIAIKDSGLALVELDIQSTRKPMLLEPLLERLFPYLHDSSNHYRFLAHSMLIKCLKYDPKTGARILPVIYNCLNSENPDVVKSACDNIAELIVCCQENAMPILKKLFSLAVRRGIDTAPHINKAINLLNMQSSY